MISNQAVVSSAGQPNLLTDSSGNPANAPQPTVVVVSATQQVSISKQVSVVGGGPPIPGAQLVYVINIVNSGAVPAYNIVVTDDLNGSQAGQLTYVNGSAMMNGSATGISFAGSTITANYGASQRTARARRGRGAQFPRYPQSQRCARHKGSQHRRGHLEQAHPDDERQCLDRRSPSSLRHPVC